jgi:hypothetical protein
MVIALGRTIPFNVIIEIARYDCRGLFNREQAAMACGSMGGAIAAAVDDRRRSDRSSRFLDRSNAPSSICANLGAVPTSPPSVPCAPAVSV